MSKNDLNRYDIKRSRFINNLNRRMQLEGYNNEGRREAILANDNNLLDFYHHIQMVNYYLMFDQKQVIGSQKKFIWL